MKVEEFLGRYELKVMTGGLWWQLYENGEEVVCGTIRASFRYHFTLYNGIAREVER